MKASHKSFFFNGHEVKPGTHEVIEFPIAQLYTHTPLNTVVHVIHGKKPGPCLLICAAIHGDEINGVEIVRQVVYQKLINKLKGTLLAIPIINVFGFIHKSRYLPDRRDLNRSFPGSSKGSIASRVANLIRQELVDKATHVIDLHTGAVHRSNLPQLRGDFSNEVTRKIGDQFGVPILINSNGTEGSLRGWLEKQKKPVITYEAGEALRFDEKSIKAGARGIIKIMRVLEMLPKTSSKKSEPKLLPLMASSTHWIRAENDGIFTLNVKLGDKINDNQIIGYIRSPYGDSEYPVISHVNGIIIGATVIPLVNEGEALVHIATFESIKVAHESIKAFVIDDS